MKSCLILCLAIIMLSSLSMGEQQTVLTESIVIKGNGTAVTEVKNFDADIHTSYVSMASGSMVYSSQIDGQNVYINTSEAMAIELEEGMKRMNKLQPLRDPFKIRRIKGVN